MNNIERSRILIVEDEIEVARKFERVLKGTSDIKITERSSKVTEEIISFAPQLILLDVILEEETEYEPRKAGVGILEKIRGLNRSLQEIPIIIITALIDSEVEASCRELGIAAFLRKPVSIHKLRQTVKQALEDSSMDTIKLLDNLVDHFNLSEMDTLCFKLEIPDGAIPGETPERKARNLIGYLQRRGRLHELVDLCRKERSHRSW